MKWWQHKRLARAGIVVAALGWLASCNTVHFYAQAAHGQWDILRRARPLNEVLADPTSSPELGRKLQLVQRLRDYAQHTLHLPVDRQFRDYSDLQRPFVVWVVFAAPEFSVEAKTWWYPLVGKLKYRGFFTEAEAKATGEQLKREGFDVHVGGTDAYSTLGWFRDPVLNTFLRRTDADLAELIFHELTHARVFLSGDTDFNEALATAFAQNATHRWLHDTHQDTALRKYEADSAKDREIVKLLLATRDTLKHELATSTDPAATKRACFTQMNKRYEAIRQRWRGDSRYDRYFAQPMNNARLNSVATYFDLVPSFERLLDACKSDPEAFFACLETMKSMNKKQRREQLRLDAAP